MWTIAIEEKQARKSGHGALTVRVSDRHLILNPVKDLEPLELCPSRSLAFARDDGAGAEPLLFAAGGVFSLNERMYYRILADLG